MNLRNKIYCIARKIKYLFKKPIEWSNFDTHEENIKRAFYKAYGYQLDLKNPQTFSEKMQWLRVYDNSPLKTKLADKYLSREYVKEKIGAEYLVPLLGVYDTFDEINFDALPEQFVIKCNHGCGYNIIVKDKNSFNKIDAKNKIATWMGENFAYYFGEIQYRDIKRKIIVEKYIENIDGDIFDYKYFCFNEKAYYILYCSDRKSGLLKNTFLDLYGNNLYFNYCGELFHENLKKPKNLELMNKLAEKLSKGFKHVRIDFYNINGKIYFGEFTFTSYGGYFNFKPKEWDLKMGNLLKLDN